MSYIIWRFKTARFCVDVTAEPEFCPDLSFDETGEIAEGIASGKYDCFCAKAAVYLDGREIAADYLGGCIYERADDFRDHIGLAEKSRQDGREYGSYFADMVAEAVARARDFIARHPAPKMRAT